MQGELEEALSSFEKIAALEPESIIPKLWIVHVLAWMGQQRKALELVDQVTDLEPPDSIHQRFFELILFFKYAYEGNKSKAVQSLSEETKSYAWNDPELPWFGTECYALMDEKEEALRWLEQAIRRGWINYPLFAQHDPFLENIRGEERFKQLMKKVKYEWERFEV